MSKSDLARLVESAKVSILRDAESLRSTDYNLRPHVFIVSTDNIKAQILRQTKRTKKLTTKQSSELDTVVLEYTTALFDTFTFRKSVTFDYRVDGTPNKFQVLVTSRDSKSDVFRKIREIRGGTTQEDKGRLKKLAKQVADIFSRDNSVTSESLKHIFDLGHSETSSVAEKMAQEALGRFSSLAPIKKDYPELTTIINLAIKSEEARLSKTFTVTVSDESYSDNRSKASTEKKELAEIRKIITSWVEKYGANWATQGGSRSAVDIILYELMSVSKKSGAKVKGTYKNKEGPSKDSTKIKGKKVVPKIVGGDFNLNISRSAQKTGPTNWSSLIGIINAKLPDRVANNMGAPGLVYRTGRFANSTKVVNVETTNDGYPSIVFDYQRNPYDVFDRTKGAAPWNTPARDPRALVDKSVREIVQEMAIGRFYTRRA